MLSQFFTTQWSANSQRFILKIIYYIRFLKRTNTQNELFQLLHVMAAMQYKQAIQTIVGKGLESLVAC